jgi:hypothetical protein
MPYSKYKNAKTIDKIKVDIFGLCNKIYDKIENKSNSILAYMEKELKKDIGRTDYSLKQLADMGHPYGIGKSEGRSPVPHAEPLIHTQSGNLLASVKTSKFISRTRGHLKVYISASDVEYVKWLVHGTSRMIGRNVFGYTWSRIKDKVIKDTKKMLSLK